MNEAINYKLEVRYLYNLSPLNNYKSNISLIYFLISKFKVKIGAL